MIYITHQGKSPFFRMIAKFDFVSIIFSKKKSFVVLFAGKDRLVAKSFFRIKYLVRKCKTNKKF